MEPRERARLVRECIRLRGEGVPQAEAARRLGVSHGFVGNALKAGAAPAAEAPKPKAEKKKPIRISRIPEIDAALERGKVHRFVITSAQDDTPVHLPFFENLLAYCHHLGADLLIGGYTYQLGLFEDHAAATAVYDPEVRPCLCTERVRLTDDLMFVGDANVLPTTASPLNGWTTANRGHHVVVPHSRVALESIPRMQGQPARYAVSTGTCTIPNYTPRAAGRKAVFHHTYGAVLAEIDADGEVFLRHLVAADDGSFQDLWWRVEGGEVTAYHKVEAVTWGDVHHEQLDPAICVASFGCRPDGTPTGWSSLLDDLMPRWQFLHDTLDFRRRNHHDLHDPHQRTKVARSSSGSVEEEVAAAARFANAVRRSWCDTVVVESNHDTALGRWLKNPEGASDPANAWFWHSLNADWHRAIMDGDEAFNVVRAALSRCGLGGDVRFVRSGDSFTLRGVECGLHGDLGMGGSRGSPNQYRRLGPKVTSGHTHSPQIVEGVYVAGVSARLDQGYNRGPTKWAHAHVVLYPNGKRTMVCMAPDGRYRATADLEIPAEALAA